MLTRVWTSAGRTDTKVTVTNPTDTQLVEACLGGDRSAFDVLVERHQRHVYQLCYRFVGNHEDASDLAQDVFIRAYRGLRNFKGHASLGTWLYRIGVNVCLNRVGAKTPKPESIESLLTANDRASPPPPSRRSMPRCAKNGRPASAMRSRDCRENSAPP